MWNFHSCNLSKGNQTKYVCVPKKRNITFLGEGTAITFIGKEPTLHSTVDITVLSPAQANGSTFHLLCFILGWSSWLQWDKCNHYLPNNSDSSTSCLCRLRKCNNPSPKNGKQCTGPLVEVTNCTVHGGWSTWSAWSACSTTCGNYSNK